MILSSYIRRGLDLFGALAEQVARVERFPLRLWMALPYLPENSSWYHSFFVLRSSLGGLHHKINEVDMKQWRLDRVVGLVELARERDNGDREYISLVKLAEETGITKRLLHYMYSNQRVRVEGDVCEILISWASAQSGIALNMSDLFEVSPEPWFRPDSVKGWGESHAVEPTIAEEGQGGRNAIRKQRIMEAKEHFSLRLLAARDAQEGLPWEDVKADLIRVGVIGG